MTATVADRPEIAHSPAVAAHGRGILVVDDEPAVLQLLDLALRQHGFRVWQARTGSEALNLYEQNLSAIDLVLLDVQMPDLDGPQTLQTLKERHPRVRCCFMSGYTGKYTCDDLFALGALGVLHKPFDLGEIARTLAQLTTPTP